MFKWKRLNFQNLMKNYVNLNSKDMERKLDAMKLRKNFTREKAARHKKISTRWNIFSLNRKKLHLKTPNQIFSMNFKFFNPNFTNSKN